MRSRLSSRAAVGVFLPLAAAIIVAGCTLPLPGGTLTGTVSATGITSLPSTARVYVKLVPQGASQLSSAQYYTNPLPSFVGGSASYLISGIQDGTYTLWAFIDVKGSAQPSATAQPVSGDYQLPANSNITITIPNVTSQNLPPPASAITWQRL